MPDKELKGGNFSMPDKDEYIKFIHDFFEIELTPAQEYLLKTITRSSRRFKQQQISISTPRSRSNRINPYAMRFYESFAYPQDPGNQDKGIKPVFSMDTGAAGDYTAISSLINGIIYTGTGKTERIAKARLIKQYRRNRGSNKIKVDWR